MTCGDVLVSALRERGFRVTAQRTIILETIAHMDGHISAQQVYEQALEQLPGLNLATVYRTVETLHEAGLIDLLSTNSDPMRFSLHDPEHPHGHLVCHACGCTEELPFEVIRQIEGAIRSEQGFRIEQGHLSFSGLCQSCVESVEGDIRELRTRDASVH
jgi:Fur family ferric uptake transcriptional regulator